VKSGRINLPKPSIAAAATCSLGLAGVLDADRSDGSSASAALDSSPLIFVAAATGSSPEFPVLAAVHSSSGGHEPFEFMLDQYGSLVMFEEVFLDGALISRVAEGSPLDFGECQ